MVDRETAVHDDCDAGFLQLAGNFVVPDTLLHPDERWMNLQQCVEQRRDVLGAAKDVDDIYGSGRGRRTKIGMDRLSQRDAADRMDRYDGVTGALKICGHSVAGPLRFPAQPHHRNPTRGADQLRQPGAVRRPPVLLRRDAAGAR